MKVPCFTAPDKAEEDILLLWDLAWQSHLEIHGS